jgi:hypothetical protein
VGVTGFDIPNQAPENSEVPKIEGAPEGAPVADLARLIADLSPADRERLAGILNRDSE